MSQDAKAKAEQMAVVFGYSEEPIRQWISSFTEVGYDLLFDEHLRTNGITVKSGNKKYDLYLTTSDDCNFCMSLDELSDNDELRKAVSMLYDSVYQAYSSIALSIDMEWNKYNPVHMLPYFNEDTMDFNVNFINKYKLEEIKIKNKLMKTAADFESCDGDDGDGDYIYNLAIEKSNLQFELYKLKDLIIAEDERCAALNKDFKSHTRLGISCNLQKSTFKKV